MSCQTIREARPTSRSSIQGGDRYDVSHKGYGQGDNNVEPALLFLDIWLAREGTMLFEVTYFVRVKPVAHHDNHTENIGRLKWH
jgi:hypothetical protein